MKNLRIIISLLLFVLSCFMFTAKGQALENTPPPDDVYEKVNTKGRVPRPYVPIREADIWRKDRVWRMVDFRQKMNQYLYYPIEPVQDRKSLMSLIVEGLENGSIIAYDPVTDDFTKQMTYEEFIKQNTMVTAEKEKQNLETGEMYMASDTIMFKTENVKMIRIKEDWLIDKQRSVRDIRILGLCPVTQEFDMSTGELKGVRPLFWLYYAHVRAPFASTDAFNRHNSAMRMSYDDVFANERFFDSFIYKIDNQQDRTISSYAKGTGIMLEAERLKRYLFEMEHDLWEY